MPERSAKGSVTPPRPGPPAAAVAALAALACLVGLAAPAHAQAGAAPATAGLLPPGRLTVLVWHPNDGVDPLGFELQDGLDGYRARYPGAGFIEYPVARFDGVHALHGLPGDGSPGAAMMAYGQAAADRMGLQAPARITLASRAGGGLATVDLGISFASAEPAPLEAWVALVEDPVHLRPALTNGVFDHRFTVRAAALAGSVRDDAALHANLTLDASWDPARLSVAAWLQAPGGTRFATREVVQATHAPLGESRTQDEKGVLVEALSATWCDPCLVGDRALEALAVEAGVARPLAPDAGFAYLRAPARPLWSAAAAAAGAALAVALARRGGP